MVGTTVGGGTGVFVAVGLGAGVFVGVGVGPGVPVGLAVGEGGGTLPPAISRAILYTSGDPRPLAIS